MVENENEPKKTGDNEETSQEKTGQLFQEKAQPNVESEEEGKAKPAPESAKNSK